LDVSRKDLSRDSLLYLTIVAAGALTVSIINLAMLPAYLVAVTPEVYATVKRVGHEEM
jgi:hypothetical protein